MSIVVVASYEILNIGQINKAIYVYLDINTFDIVQLVNRHKCSIFDNNNEIFCSTYLYLSCEFVS